MRDTVDSTFVLSPTGAAFSLGTRYPALPYAPSRPAPIAAAPAGHGGSVGTINGA